jgi:hypothetical protein
MPLQHFSRVLSVDQCLIYKLLTEPGSGIGAATYAAGITVVGVRNISWVPTYASKELRGDNQVLETDVIPGVVTGKLEFAKIHQDALALFWGGTQADAGVTPNQTSNFTLTGGQLPVYWKVEARCKTTDFFTVPGDVHFVLYKCKIVTGPDEIMTDADYGMQTLTFKAVQARSTDPVARIVFNETAAVIT